MSLSISEQAKQVETFTIPFIFDNQSRATSGNLQVFGGHPSFDQTAAQVQVVCSLNQIKNGEVIIFKINGRTVGCCVYNSMNGCDSNTTFYFKGNSRANDFNNQIELEAIDVNGKPLTMSGSVVLVVTYMG